MGGSRRRRTGARVLRVRRVAGASSASSGASAALPRRRLGLGCSSGVTGSALARSDLVLDRLRLAGAGSSGDSACAVPGSSVSRACTDSTAGAAGLERPRPPRRRRRRRWAAGVAAPSASGGVSWGSAAASPPSSPAGTAGPRRGRLLDRRLRAGRSGATSPSGSSPEGSVTSAEDTASASPVPVGRLGPRRRRRRCPAGLTGASTGSPSTTVVAVPGGPIASSFCSLNARPFPVWPCGDRAPPLQSGREDLREDRIRPEASSERAPDRLRATPTCGRNPRRIAREHLSCPRGSARGAPGPIPLGSAGSRPTTRHVYP
jgi:hypothetical protein